MKALSYINVLSLDVVLGAVSCSLFLSSQWRVHPSWQSLALLGCVVWLIYTFDHLKDVYGRTELPQTARHTFHARYFTSLMVASIVILFVSLILLLQVNEQVLRLGTALMVLVGIYFLMLHFLRSNARYHKEPAISVLYAAGILIPALGVADSGLTGEKWLHFVQLAALALGNLLCFSLYEYNTDRQAGFPSIMQVLPVRTGHRLLLLFLGLQVILAVFLGATGAYPLLQLVYALMATILFALAAMLRLFRNAAFFRLAGDAVFILPLLFYLFSNG